MRKILFVMEIQLISRSYQISTIYCRSMNIYFDSKVSSAAIQNYIVNKLEALGLDRNGYWIGAHDRNWEGNFEWDSG